MFGDLFLKIRLRRAYQEQDNEHNTPKYSTTGRRAPVMQYPTRRLSLPSGPGGGLTSPRGITAARPPFFILRLGAKPLGFIDFGDFGDLKRLWHLLEPVGAILEALEPS